MSIINVKRKYLTPGQHQQSGQSCVAYLDSLKPHHINDLVQQRNERITTNCGSFAVVLRQRDRQLIHSNKRKNAVDVFSIVQSFSTEELSYRSNSDIDKAHQIGIATAKALNNHFHDEREWAVYTQIDGDTHCIHNHIVYMNYDSNLQALKELSWKKVLLPINENISDQYLITNKQKAVRQRTLKTAEEIIGIPSAVKRQRRHDQREQAKEYIAETVKSTVKRAKSETEFKLMLLQQNIKIQQRNSGKDESVDGIESAWRTKSGRYRKSLAFTYNNVTMRSDKFGLSTKDIVEQIQENAATTSHLPERTSMHKNSQQEQIKLTKKMPKVAQNEMAKRPQTSKALVTNSVKFINRYQLLNIKRDQATKLQNQLTEEKLTQEQRNSLLQKLNNTQSIVAELQSQISVDLTQKSIEEQENERES